jgi:hypothetical protein
MEGKTVLISGHSLLKLRVKFKFMNMNREIS